ncbi:MAG: FHA domain-containing protein, partial [Roseimicrobium sp.]
MASLVFAIEGQPDIVVPIVGAVTLGSADGNDVLVDDASISATHAEVGPTDSGGYQVRDLGSRNGTYVNGKRVRKHDLRDGDEVGFGVLRGYFVLGAEDKAEPKPSAKGSEVRKQSTAELDAAYNEALARHQTLMGVIQGLGDEEKKRMANLDDL